MRFKKQFKGGGSDGDVRQKHYLEFVCDCGALKDIEISLKDKSPEGLQKLVNEYSEKLRVCPFCHAESKDDMKNKLEQELAFLINARNDLNVKINEVTNKLTNLEKQAVNN